MALAPDVLLSRGARQHRYTLSCSDILGRVKSFFLFVSAINEDYIREVE
jgi:ABC-type Zn2+ transport system substrate-binding protein/surface adhesin